MDDLMVELTAELEKNWGWQPNGSHFDFGNDHEFFKACLKAFSQDYAFERLDQAFKIKDRGAMAIEAHTLKGVCVNLGLESLASDLDLLKEKLGSGDVQGLEQQANRINEWQRKLQKLVKKMDL